MTYLVECLSKIWEERKLNYVEDWAKLGGRANVGCGSESHVEQLVRIQDLCVTEADSEELLRDISPAANSQSRGVAAF